MLRVNFDRLRGWFLKAFMWGMVWHFGSFCPAYLFSVNHSQDYNSACASKLYHFHNFFIEILHGYKIMWQTILRLNCKYWYCLACRWCIVGFKVKARSYAAQYPVLRTIQSTLHFTSLTDQFTQTPSRLLWEASSRMLQLIREGYSYTYPPLSIARYSFI